MISTCTLQNCRLQEDFPTSLPIVLIMSREILYFCLLKDLFGKVSWEYQKQGKEQVGYQHSDLLGCWPDPAVRFCIEEKKPLTGLNGKKL